MPGHTAQFYRDERFLIQSVTAFIKVGLNENEPVLVIATPSHRKNLYTTLTNKELFNEKLVFWDVEDSLALFMVEDWPNQEAFMRGMDLILRPLCDKGQIRVFGEMVAVLYTRGNAAAALKLEELWNALATRYDFSLLCAYPQSVLYDDGAVDTRQRILRLHQRVHIQ